MAKNNCAACEDLREYAPDFVVNGVTKNVCNSLMNDTGLNASASGTHTNCGDLKDANDCLVGNMVDEIDAYGECDWKDFTRNFISNLYNVIYAMICSMCGLWKRLKKIECEIDHLVGDSDSIYTLVPNEGNKFRMAGGVSINGDDAPLVMRIAGTIGQITGSIKCDGNMPSSYTNNITTKWTDYSMTNVLNNEIGELHTIAHNTHATPDYYRPSKEGNLPYGGFLIYEYEVRACDYGFKRGYNADLFAGLSGNFIARITFHRAGDTIPYDYGYDYDSNGNAKGHVWTPSNSKYDTLIQVRMTNIVTWGTTGNGQITPNGTFLVKPCRDSWDCD